MLKYLLFTISIVAFYFVSKPPDSSVVFLDVGQGSSVLIQDKSCQVLYDVGNYYTATYRLGKHMPLTDKVIEHVIISHFDLDHYGGIFNLLERYQIQNIWIHHYSQIPQELKPLISFQNIQSSNTLCGISFNTLWPNSSSQRSDSKNENSIVLDFNFRGHTFLLTADIGCISEPFIHPTFDFVNVLQTGHHGSRFSNCTSWLARINPDYIVTQSGLHNSYNHPHPDFINRLQNIRATHLRTDQVSDIIFDVGAQKLQVYSSRSKLQVQRLDRFLESRVL